MAAGSSSHGVTHLFFQGNQDLLSIQENKPLLCAPA